MRKTALALTITPALLVLALIAALAFGGPKPIAPLASINKPFEKVDSSDVPATRSFAARDGTRLAWLAYPAAGITAWNHLAVLQFGLDESIKQYLTSSYGYNLTLAFGPHGDYQGDIRGARQPMRVVAGSEDELFDASRYADTFAEAGRPVPVTVVPGVSHMGLTLDLPAVPAIIEAARM